MNKNYGISVAFLIVANLIPIIGVLFYNFSMFQVIFLYWSESGIIGFFSILKILIKTRPIVMGAFLSLFFSVHFGMFMMAHLFFIFFLFGNNVAITDLILPIILPIGALFISHFVSFISNFILKGEYKITGLSSSSFPPYSRIFVMQFTIILSGMFFTLFSNLFNVQAIGTVILILFKIIVDINAHIKSHNMNNLTDFNNNIPTVNL